MAKPRGLVIYAALGAFVLVAALTTAWAYRTLRSTNQNETKDLSYVPIDADSKSSSPLPALRRDPLPVRKSTARDLRVPESHLPELQDLPGDGTERNSELKDLERKGLVLLEEAVRSAPRDSSAEVHLREQLANSQSLVGSPSAAVGDVQCNSNLCRVIFTTTSTNVPEGSSIALQLSSLGPHGGIVVLTNSELVGEGKILGFISKPGRQLPVVPG
jgi:hypothetical protein